MVFASGSTEYLNFVLPKLKHHQGPFVYATDIVFMNRRPGDVARLYAKWTSLRKEQGLMSSIVTHAKFGGVTSAFHLLSYYGVDATFFRPPPSLPRVLIHIINPATPNAAEEAPLPTPLSIIPRSPIVSEGSLRSEGLLDVFCPQLRVLCPCVFKPSGWVHQHLTMRENLQAFDTPLTLDDALLDRCRKRRICCLLPWSITPLVASATFCALWSELEGGARPADAEQPGLTSHGKLEMESSKEEVIRRINWKGEGTKLNTADEVRLDGQMVDSKAGLDETMVDSGVSEDTIRKLARSWSPTTRYEFGIKEETSSQTGGIETAEILEDLRVKHDIAKAVKADDEKVPVELWDKAVCRHPPTIKQQEALSILHGFALHLYHLKLWRNARSFLRHKHGKEWTTKIRISGLAGGEDANASRDILWHAAGNDWFEYPTGLHLIFFRFPVRYCMQAKRGVRVMFSSKGPSTKQQQPLLMPEEKEVLQIKIIKFVDQKYIAPPSGKIKSLIKYFAVPKGTDDRRIVFHAGANKLNDCVWTPSFCLPTVNSLLRITDEGTLMQDMDVSEMFLNF